MKSKFESNRKKILTREIPWDDLTNNTNGLMTRIDEFVLVGLDSLTVDLVGPAGIVADGSDRLGDIDGRCYGVGLSIIKGLDSGKLSGVRFHEVRKFVQKNTALGTRGVKTPGGVEGILSGLDSEIDILGRTRGDRGNDLASRRVDHTVRFHQNAVKDGIAEE